MNSLKKLFVAISLTVIFAGTALAECPQPNPGEVNGPPCSAAQQLSDDSTDQSTTAATISSAVNEVVLDGIIAGLENLLTVY